MTLYAYKHLLPQVHESVFIAPSALVIGDVHMAKNSSVWFQTVIRGDLARISIGKETNIQDLCMCHVDENTPLTVGNGVTIGHKCCIHGCTIEDNCLIGMGAIVMDRAVIGEGAIIAAGAVVLEKTVIPPYSLVTGSPGRVKKTYADREKIDHMMKHASDHYMGRARTYASRDLFYEIPR